MTKSHTSSSERRDYELQRLSLHTSEYSDLERAHFLHHHKDTATTDDVHEDGPLDSSDEDSDIEDPTVTHTRQISGGYRGVKPGSLQRPRWYFVATLTAFAILLWLGALLAFHHGFLRSSTTSDSTVDAPASPLQTPSNSDEATKKIELDDILHGKFLSKQQSVRWILGPNGEDGQLLTKGDGKKDYLVVEDVRSASIGPSESTDTEKKPKWKTLLREASIQYQNGSFLPSYVWPNRKLTKVLVATHVKQQWRHSFTAYYWIVDVETQNVEPLLPDEPWQRVQLASWSPNEDTIAFTRENNLYIRSLSSFSPQQVTKDGGVEFFYGIPDWVYEEEIFGTNTATWWSDDGKYLAFMRTNETGVPHYDIPFYVSRPSERTPLPGEETYPEHKPIKYPRPGSHNPVVDVFFYDLSKQALFTVDVDGYFAEDDRILTNVLWAGNRVILKSTNRVSDILQVSLIDVEKRTGKTISRLEAKDIDNGWFEISPTMTYVPADPAKGRKQDGYVDTVIHDNYIHLAYFSPVDNPQPKLLTSGDYEVTDSPAGVDLDQNIVYFVSTKESSIQRHVYSVKLDGTQLTPITDTTNEGYYEVSYSTAAKYALLSYQGPGVPWQKIISMPNTTTHLSRVVEDNKHLAGFISQYQQPQLEYGTINVDGVSLNYLERRPSDFDPTKKYPVLFQQYSGPGSQSVTKKWAIDFQSFVAAGVGYIVVTVDGRGTGYIGRKNRVCVRGQFGRYESHDQIEAGKHWAAKPYVDPEKLAIWGWSFGGYNTLKVLENDAGHTFSYGIAVAPVTDWRFYDSLYTERYLKTPQDNKKGYDGTAVQNGTALGENVRFLLMHGVADDNVHFQNLLDLVDRLNSENVINYDVMPFPDSNHGIYFHNSSYVVYHRLTNWLVNAFNGVWKTVKHAQPVGPS